MARIENMNWLEDNIKRVIEVNGNCPVITAVNIAKRAVSDPTAKDYVKTIKESGKFGFDGRNFVVKK